MTIRWALGLLTLAISLTASSAVSAQEKRVVHFAGFALSGDAAKSSDNFPYTKELIDKQDKTVQLDFNKSLFDKIGSQTFENVQISPDPGDYRKNDALVLAFVRRQGL